MHRTTCELLAYLCGTTVCCLISKLRSTCSQSVSPADCLSIIALGVAKRACKHRWCWPGFSPDLCSVSVIWGNGQCQPLRWTIHPLMRECCCMQGIQSRQTIPERSSVVILFGHSRKDEETGTHADIVLDVIRVQGELLVPRCVGSGVDLKPKLLGRLNQTFLNDRRPVDYLGMSKKEKGKALRSSFM